MTERLRELISRFSGERGATIPILQAIQAECGYVPEQSFDLMEELVGIPSSKAYGVATFYAQFRLRPVGKYLVKACDGTACHVNGARTILSSIKDHLRLGDSDTTTDGLFTLEEVACLGCCSLAPVMMIDGSTYGTLTIEKMRNILESYRDGDNADG